MLLLIFSLIFSFFDIKNRRISVPFLGICYLASIVFLFFTGGSQLLIRSFIISILSFCAYFIMWLLSRKKFGFGDVLYSALCGLFIPNPLYIWIFMIGPVVLALVFLFILLIMKREPGKNFRLPYIPFMSLSAILLLLLIRTGVI